MAPTTVNALDVNVSLSELYSATGGINGRWYSSTNWGTATDPCTWYGVTCAAGEPLSLDLSGNYLAGSLPTEFGALTTLVDLDLSNNFMNGTLPTELGSLTGVQSLNLGSTMDLTKYWSQTSWSTIPSQFGMLTALTGDMDLSNNWFTGSLPSELGKLTLIDGSLEMDNNRLTGTIPRDLSIVFFEAARTAVPP